MAQGKGSLVDQKLVIRIKGGDEKAFEELYRIFSKKIYYTARRMNLCHEDAEGIVQEVFFRIWKNRADLDPSLSINAYMISIVRSLVIKKVKKEARFFAFQKYKIPLYPDASNMTEDELIYNDLHRVSSEMVSQLPQGQKQIFMMRNMEFLSVEQIADRLNLSRRTVENQIFRATKSIKEKLYHMKIISSTVGFLVAGIFKNTSNFL